MLMVDLLWGSSKLQVVVSRSRNPGAFTWICILRVTRDEDNRIQEQHASVNKIREDRKEKAFARTCRRQEVGCFMICGGASMLQTVNSLSLSLSLLDT